MRRVRILVIIVALVALALAIIVVQRRSVVWMKLSEDYAFEAQIHTQEAANGKQLADSMSRLAAQYPYGQSEMKRTIDSALALEHYHSELRRKYERAASHPWEPLSPDPPAPPAPEAAVPLQPGSR
jgi:hypothetical protein